MDFAGNIFCLATRDLNGNTNGNSNSNNDNSSGNTTFAWDSWNPTTPNGSVAEGSAASRRHEGAGLANALMFLPHHQQQQQQQQHHHPYGASHVQYPDPHLMCLKLGKRHYFEDTCGGSGSVASGDKRGRGGGAGAAVAAAVPRCQVEGCHMALLNAKDYHRRHKVCEMHSKAPKVVVLGMEQRFCQQCSRFHVVSEFDDSKRSCRRRLAGHNERRRKSSHDSAARNSSQGGCALSLLSSRSDSWLSPSDLSTRCSAALRELIAENRAAIMSRQFVSDRDWQLHHHAVEEFKEIQPESNYFPQQMFPQTQ
ncbi:hypothetical protein Fmac_011355 [Flemingia macrophylla]|uniref:SBP-type domain-containing protein n=1 Tax=Flemingia macrophylla TaxID=520843 RepID=A0ABD1MM84_9FABA